MANWLDEFFLAAAGTFGFYEDGTAKPTRRKLNFIGATITDDTINERLDIEVAATISAALPQALGTAAAGASGEVSDAAHVHAHGNLAGGSLHAVAVAAGASGFMTGADKTILDGLVRASTTPEAVAAAGAVGVGTTLARADHVHAHGLQAGGSLHADATQIASGFMSGADKTILDNAVATATASTLCMRDGSGDCAFVGVACQALEASSYVETPLVARSSTGSIEVSGFSGVLLSHGSTDCCVVSSPAANTSQIESSQDYIQIVNSRSGGQVRIKTTQANGSVLYDTAVFTLRDRNGTYDYWRTLQDGTGLNPWSTPPSAGCTWWQDIATSPRGQLRTLSALGVYTELNARDVDGSGATTKALYDRLCRLTSTTSSLTQDKTLIAAADLPASSPEWVARVEVEWAAFDTNDNTIAGGTRRATVSCVAGTVTVHTSAANQVIGTDDNTTAGSVAGSTANFLRTGGTDLQFRFATLKTNNIRFWAKVRTFLVEH